jgi:hypothetical protein
VLRAGIVAEEPVSAFMALYPLLVRDSLTNATRKVLTACKLTATSARNLSSFESELCCEFRQLVTHSVDVVAYSIDQDAGADVAFTVVDGDGTRRLVLVQAKVETRTSLAECLRAATPAWQYTTELQRAALLRGNSNSVPSSSKRVAFEKLAVADSVPFDRALRVVFCVNGFFEKTLKMCRNVNKQSACAHSPVVLCSLQHAIIDLLPRELVAVLLNSCRDIENTLHPVAHPKSASNIALWAPRMVCEFVNLMRTEGPDLLRASDEKPVKD